MERRTLLILAIVLLFGVVVYFFSGNNGNSVAASASSRSSTSLPKQTPRDASPPTTGTTIATIADVPAGDDKKPADPMYPSGRPDRTLSLTSPFYRKQASLCRNKAVAVGSLPIPWMVDDTVIAGFGSWDELVNDDGKNWGYVPSPISTAEQRFEAQEKEEDTAEKADFEKRAKNPDDTISHQQHNNEHPNQQRCSLPFGHVRRLLARTRISALLTARDPPKWLHGQGDEAVSGQAQEQYLERLNKLLKKHAPAWRVQLWRFADHAQQAEGRGRSGSGLGGGEILLERRAKVFVFGITGGNMAVAARARYAEMTWGARTPIQWFSDQWDPAIRPIVDMHPLYVKDRFKYLTFKISRVWQLVYKFYAGSTNERIDWYIRLWDDNYFYEENLFPILYRIPGMQPHTTPVLAGKLGVRHLGPQDAIFPFAGGGAGWYMSRAGMVKFGPSIPQMEAWIPKLRARKDIFLPHDMHDEDVFLTAWIGKYMNISCVNIPGVEHVSPGMAGKQRCMTDTALSKLRWDPRYTIFFDYTGVKQRELRVEDTWYAYTKPLVWHYMSPKRLLRLEGLLYPDRAASSELPAIATAPATVVDNVKKNKRCYPGVPEGNPPARGLSLFEAPLPSAMRDKLEGGGGGNGNADAVLGGTGGSGSGGAA